VRVRRLATVSNDVHPTDHLTNSEEANDLSGGNTGESQLLGAGVADTGEESRGRGERLESGGVVDEGLEVGLESGQVARRLVRFRLVVCGGRLTGEPCFGHGTPACRAPGRPWSSTESGESWLDELMVSCGLCEDETRSLEINKEVGLGGYESDRVGLSIVVLSFEEYPIPNASL
jgi:hypothetical protein